MADEVVGGDEVKQYSMLWSYVVELKKQCVRSTVKIALRGHCQAFHLYLRDYNFVLMDARKGLLKVADLLLELMDATLK